MSETTVAADEATASTLAEELVAQLDSTRHVVGELQVQIDERDETIKQLSHEITLLRRRIYGNKTERQGTDETQLSFGELLEEQTALRGQLDKEFDEAASQTSDAAGGDDEAPQKKKRTGGGRRDWSLSTLPRVVVEVTDPRLESQGKRIGHEDSYQLMHRPASRAVLVKRVYKYELRQGEETTVLAASTPKSPFPYGMLHTSMAAHLYVQKFRLGTPFYRLEQHLKDQDAPLDRATMCRYAEAGGNLLGATVVAAMWRDAKQCAAVLSTDATGAMIQPERVRKKKKERARRQACRRGHFFTVVADCDHVLFHYVEKHNQQTVKEMFADFAGYLQADASNVYDILDRGPPDQEAVARPTLVACWAHCRRYFFEAAVCKYSVGVMGLMRIGTMYAMEELFRSKSPVERQRLRDQHLRPLMGDFFDWVEAERLKTRPKDLASKALGYAQNQKSELLAVLEDPRLPLDNTRSERALRKIVVGRKNWLFYGSDVHAEAAAALFTLLASAALHRIEPEAYFDEVLRLLPYWPRHRFLELSPKYWLQTRAKLDPAELARPIGSFTIPD